MPRIPPLTAFLKSTAGLALGLAALPAFADGPCMPRYAPGQTVAQVHSDGHVEAQGVGDFDGDGWSDVLVTRLMWQTRDAFEISILLNDPQKGLRDATADIFEGPVTKTVNPKAILLEDFNGDGRLDAFIADHGMDQPPWPMAQNLLILSTPEGKLRDATDQLPQILDFTHSATAADIDGDGDIDIFAGNDFVGPPPHFLINDGTGTFTVDLDRVPRRTTDMGFNWFSGVFLTDVDNDASPDLILGQGHHDRRWSYVLLNDGTGHFAPLDTPLPFPPLSPFDVAISFAAADLDGDGNVDLLKHHATNDWDARRDIQLLFGNGDGTFRDETDAHFDQNRNAQWMKWAEFVDLNHDGFLDIVGWPLDGPQLFLLSDGAGSFVPWRSPFWIGNMAILDVNRDGKLDILSISQATPEVNMLEDYDLMTFISCY